jgi:hypothetical protein
MRIILLFIYFINCNSFAINIIDLQNKNEYLNIINSRKNSVILYTGAPCTNCQKIISKISLIDKTFVDDWNFYNIDVRKIFDICKSKNINYIPVYELYNKNRKKSNILDCLPFFEENFVQNIKVFENG